ncbi:hypothetical protein [Altererythrobacter sp. Root672]|uniref:hypothetical protein n=1 Tax=Altererythrobacter sp. Root672 TaxID=1736584 RepID=UPI0006F7C806|nr:hypothetical protein [Altererythrobacter sp. Root672]KRA84575.1 hypothetical protein ASD76_02810 [Altererythrobacter sp. Root672]
MKSLLVLAATALSTGLATPAFAQDHAGHGDHTPAPAPAPAPTETHDHSQMDHGAMDHSQMDHGQHPGTYIGPDPRFVSGCRSASGVLEDGGMVDGVVCRPTEASGTSRLPAAEGMMPGQHFDIGGGWMGMAHGYLWGVYTDQTGPRGDDKLYVQSMAMLMAEKQFGGARLQFRSMMSAEPLMNNRGYPNLFATGETADGEPLVDRQHPHDLFMELAVRADVDIGEGTKAFFYGGPVGEPALGPPAFMHRASAKLNPEAPITHHWFDSTHITYGVVTAGVAGKVWQLEASAFRGEEPDEDRWDIETPRLDSWSVRATLNPSDNWAMQVSYAQLDQPEPMHPGQDEKRTTASVHYNSGNGLAATAAFSAKDRVPGPTLIAWLAEANWDLTEHHTLFGRIENVENDELFPDHDDPLHDQLFQVTKLQAGYAYSLPLGPFGLSLGGSVATFLKPEALDAVYGNNPMGYTVFAKLNLVR